MIAVQEREIQKTLRSFDDSAYVLYLWLPSVSQILKLLTFSIVLVDLQVQLKHSQINITHEFGHI